MTQGRDHHWLRAAYAIAGLSPDPSTQNGAVLVDYRSHPGLHMGLFLTEECNRIPKGVAPSTERLERPEKYLWMEHAERGVIYRAARQGFRTEGTTMYCPWFACMDCARAIIQAGIRDVVGHRATFDRTDDRWADQISKAIRMFDEAGVHCRIVEEKLGCLPIRFNGALLEP